MRMSREQKGWRLLLATVVSPLKRVDLDDPGTTAYAGKG